MNDKKFTNLPVELISRLRAIFNLHDWSVDQDETFDRFCQMLRTMNKEQQDCILELTRIFLRVDFQKYPFHIGRALSKINVNLLNNIDRIYVLPIRTEKDFGKQKSSTFVAYGLHDFKTNNLLYGKTINIIDTLSGLPRNFNLTPSLLLLVDDFIGTGETAEGCINYLKQTLGIELSKILILALVVQREGYERISGLGVEVVYSEIRQKGIADGFQPPLRQEFTDVMRAIEDKYNFEAEIRFGYKQSEALVKMIRTPNNTFPVYWNSRTSPEFDPPFPR